MKNTDQQRYATYKVRDFICDEFFQDWVLRPSDESVAYWACWMAAFPHKKETVSEARHVLERLVFKTDMPAAGKADASLREALQVIKQRENADKHRQLYKIQRLRKVAAILLSVIGISAALLLLRNAPIKTVNITTAYGKVDSIVLPDQSLVLLNANSSVRFKRKWAGNAPRELWLTGEALFEIKHLDRDHKIQPFERFLVHVSGATIEVLGTTFNIRQRRRKTEIALLKGAISVHFDDPNRSNIPMQPGEVVVLDSTTVHISKSGKTAEDYSSWTKKRLILSNPTLQRIADYLEDIYGKKIMIATPRLAARRIEGPILLDSFDDALFVLSTVLDVKITYQNDTLIISPQS